MVEQPVSVAGWWVPPGQPATVGAYVIPGGSIYVGRHLRAQSGGVEPALINPNLPVTASGAPNVAPSPGPALAYHLLSPAARAAYLEWLADGRNAEVPDSLVLLFCFGVERRVLVDAEFAPAVRRELPVLAAEVRRLRARYSGGRQVVRSTLDRLLDLLELLTAPRIGPSVGGGPAVHEQSSLATGRAPGGMAVRVAVAQFAAASAPVPADWALAWAQHNPSLSPRDAQVRCPEEFDRLFKLRYRDHHGAGLIPPDDVPGVRLKYQPASPGLTTTLVCREDLPDALADPRSTRALGAVIDDVAAALDPYRRWLARFPQGRGSLAAAPLLPMELIDANHGQLGALRVWAEARLDGRPWAVIDAGEFAAFWSTASPDRMARDEATALIAVLALLGLGIEPDVRFAAPALAPGPAILFHLGRPAADRPGSRFLAAAAVARCAAAVASAAGPVDPRGPAGKAVLASVRDLAALLCMDPGEDLRLLARLGWLLITGVDVNRLARQATLLDQSDRELAGRYLVAVAAAADPVIGPATVAMLTRVYRILGLEPDLVFARLHEQSVGGSPVAAHASASTRSVRSPGPAAAARPDDRDEPIVVRPADAAAANGYALPWATTPPLGDEAATTGEIPLDRAMIMRKLAESATAATILTAIFDAEAAPDTGAMPMADVPPQASQAQLVVGLDLAHSLLLRTLATRQSWTREEFAVLAAQHGVLRDAALDLLNEAAIDAAGAPVVDDDDTLSVNYDVLLELLA